MTADTVVPVLPCGPLGETLTFYRALGFEVTHEQTWPYQYGAVRRHGAEVHFHGPRRIVPGSAMTCLVLVSDLAGTHAALVAGLKRGLGKLPTAGTPRITRLRPGHLRLAVFDPVGNQLVFIARDEPDKVYDDVSDTGRTRLARALDTAELYRDWKGFDDVKAARLLDHGLARRDGTEPPADLARALAARAELAVALGETGRAAQIRRELEAVPLTEVERAGLRDELGAADDLERLIAAPPPAEDGG